MGIFLTDWSGARPFPGFVLAWGKKEPGAFRRLGCCKVKGKCEVRPCRVQYKLTCTKQLLQQELLDGISELDARRLIAESPGTMIAACSAVGWTAECCCVRSEVNFWATLPCFDSLLLLLVATIMRALTVIAIESALADEPYSVDADACCKEEALQIFAR